MGLSRGSQQIFIAHVALPRARRAPKSQLLQLKSWQNVKPSLLAKEQLRTGATSGLEQQMQLSCAPRLQLSSNRRRPEAEISPPPPKKSVLWQ